MFQTLLVQVWYPETVSVPDPVGTSVVPRDCICSRPCWYKCGTQRLYLFQTLLVQVWYPETVSVPDPVVTGVVHSDCICSRPCWYKCGTQRLYLFQTLLLQVWYPELYLFQTLLVQVWYPETVSVPDPVGTSVVPRDCICSTPCWYKCGTQ